MPPIPCPCCRAANDVGPACRRCKADLSLLFAVAADRERLVSAARDQLADGNGTEALALLDQAERTWAGDDLRPLRAVAHLLNRDFPAAFACYSAGARS